MGDSLSFLKNLLNAYAVHGIFTKIHIYPKTILPSSRIQSNILSFIRLLNFNSIEFQCIKKNPQVRVNLI